MIIFLLVIILIFSVVYFINIKTNIIKTEGYFRDLETIDYGPAIASLLLDLNTEITKDYTATIINLCNKKYLEMEKEGENYKFHLINNSILNLKEHERYVEYCLINGEKFNPDKFKKSIRKDAIKLGLAKEGIRSINAIKKICISIFVYCILGIILNFVDEGTIVYNILGILGAISALSVFANIGISIYMSSKATEENFIITKKGKADAKKWSQFKNYIKDYTLIGEKNIEYVTILENYLPYAIALGEAKQIEKFIITNEDYKKIIYKGMY